MTCIDDVNTINNNNSNINERNVKHNALSNDNDDNNDSKRDGKDRECTGCDDDLTIAPLNNASATRTHTHTHPNTMNTHVSAVAAQSNDDHTVISARATMATATSTIATVCANAPHSDTNNIRFHNNELFWIKDLGALVFVLRGQERGREE